MPVDIYREIAEIKERGEEAVLVTVIAASGSTPREEGAKMLVRSDGSTTGTIGGGNVELVAIKEALKVLSTGKPTKLDYRLREGEELGMICGGDVELFLEPVFPDSRLYIFGGGHIALTLVKMAPLVGFRVVVIDDRPDFASKHRFPDAEEVLVSDFAEAFNKLRIRRSDYIVIVTHGHKGDETVLANSLATQAKYIGMIGSQAKNQAVFSHLKERGFTQEALDRVHAPIGLKIGAETPEEIAVSILAELIQVRRKSLTGEKASAKICV